MRVEDYAKYINVLHDLALVEDDLRDILSVGHLLPQQGWAERILFERFGHS